MNNGTYQPQRSIAFTILHSVKREIFAAAFKDRIVHHVIIGRLNPFFEKEFILDSYACRKGKGTSFGIKRIERFIRKCSKNFTQPCYILKLDVQGFFMHIDRSILHRRLHAFIEKVYDKPDKEKILTLCKTLLEHNPAKNCLIKGSSKDWDDLPRDKSLFFSKQGCSLPIGNLTSQIFANFYMNSFDHFMKSTLRLKYYGRYVDDFIIIHEDKHYLKKLIVTIREFLINTLNLTLHPKKIFLQH